MGERSRTELQLPGGASAQLREVYELLIHERIARRKRGVAGAATLLRGGIDADRETVVQWLRAVMEHDPMLTVREAARAALTGAADEAPQTVIPRDYTPHRFLARCPAGHETEFDRREVCGRAGTIYRSADRTALDRLLLTCAVCGQQMIVAVDCEGYR